MKKWIYGSISLNVYAFLSFISIIWTWKPFWDIVLSDSTGAGGIVGFVFAPISFLCTITLIILYIIELLIYRFVKKYAFTFPYDNIKYKYSYLIYFYIGIFWTTWLGFLCIITLPMSV